MKHTVTDRGFKHMEPFKCTYGTKVRAYESSIAEAPHVWLNLKEGQQLGCADASAHLTLDQAEYLAKQLLWLVEHHYQVAKEAE